jgi:hypothetical protein
MLFVRSLKVDRRIGSQCSVKLQLTEESLEFYASGCDFEGSMIAAFSQLARHHLLTPGTPQDATRRIGPKARGRDHSRLSEIVHPSM